MALILNSSVISRSLTLLSTIIDFLNYLINVSINNRSIHLVILDSLYSYSNLSRRSLILVVSIILINLSLFSVISFNSRIMLIRTINNSSISLARESLLYIITTFKTIKAIKYRRIKIIKKTLVSRSQLR